MYTCLRKRVKNVMWKEMCLVQTILVLHKTEK